LSDEIVRFGTLDQASKQENVSEMTTMYIYIWSFVLLFGLSAVGALAWAVQSGQLANFQSGATSIFDEDEPVGEITDAFPTSVKPQPAESKKT